MMNLVDCYVTAVLGQPYRKFGNWWVDVTYESWGSPGKTQLMFSTEAGAAAVEIGHHFLA
ncbi:hypothetical protein [Pseudomonas frederiksbergensis]|uniref:hypothetical protein n=1 Tax=Pseudomonas frederiksbergensis TaxID=104087 RepID=UPI0011CDC960|nr:hypothetical protein [Pseudomonas frederiksbergensis]